MLGTAAQALYEELTIGLHARCWVVHDIEEQVLKAAAQIIGSRLVRVFDGLQLFYGHQLIWLRWQTCAIMTHHPCMILSLGMEFGKHNTFKDLSQC